MRILLSGMTKMQANRPRRREYNTSINALYHALKAAKHKVEWRALEYDEQNLNRKFDLLILGLGTISEFSCSYLYETILASRADNVLYLVNDWKANSTIKLLEVADLFRDFVLRGNTGKRLNPRMVIRDERLIEKCRNRMFRCKDNLLGPFFSFGDRSIITEGTKFSSIYEFNPSDFYLKNWKGKIELPKVKKKQWVYGALADYSKWHKKLGIEWPILSFNKKTFIPENELVKLYAKSVGMLMPKYKASGSGWWRARYCHAIMCRNVIYCEHNEVPLQSYHGPFCETIDWIERRSSPKELMEIADHQRGLLLKSIPSWDSVVDTVDCIVREAV